MKFSIYIFCLALFANVTLLKAQKKQVVLGEYTNVYLKGKDTLVLRWASEGRTPFMVLGEDLDLNAPKRTGFLDAHGRVVIDASFSDCSMFKGGYAVVLSTDTPSKYGLIDSLGKTVLPAIYDEIGKCLNGLYLVRKNGFIGFLNISGKMIVPFGRYTLFATPPPNYVEGDDTPYNSFRWIPLSTLSKVYFGRYLGVKAGEKWAVIDSIGKEVISPRYDGLGIFNGNWATAKIGNKVGIINTTGKMIVPALYDRVDLSGKDFAYVTNRGKTGALSVRNNKLLVPIDYSSVVKFGVGFVAYDEERKATLYDEGGKRISNAVYYLNLNFPVWGNDQEGYFVYNKSEKKFYPYQGIADFKIERRGRRQLFFQKNKKWGLMDTTGRETSQPLFDDIDRDHLQYYDGSKGDLFVAWLNQKCGIVNTSGKVFLPIEQDYLTLDEGAVIIHRGRKYGVWANKLMKVTPPLYDSVAVTRLYDHDNSTRFVRVRNHNKWALLDGGGAEVTPFKYGSFQWFYRQLAIVEIDGKYGIINSRGKEIVPCVYSSIENGADNKGQFIVKKGIYFGIIDSAGKTVAPVIYNRIIVLHSFFAGKYRVMYQGKIGLLDGATKKIVIPCEYDDIKFPGNDSYGYDYGNNYTDSQYLIACKMATEG